MRLLSPGSIVLIAVFATLLFGSKRLPGAARSLGQSLRILKSEAKALRDPAPPAEQPVAEPSRVVKAAPGAPAQAESGRVRKD